MAESTAANRALSAQLENIAPQLTSLEGALTDSRRKLKEEQELRRAAEQAQDDADQRLREMEESIQHVREECDVVHEELAFKNDELEELRLELDVEKEQLQAQVNELQKQLESREKEIARSTALMDQDSTAGAGGANVANQSMESTESADEGYVKKLEEELELVTEQLIETENRLSEAEGQVEDLQKQVSSLRNSQTGARSEDDDDLIRNLQMENADRLENEQKYVEDITILKEELTLTKEEMSLLQEELQHSEEVNKELKLQLEEEQIKHREAVTTMTIQMKETDVANKSSLEEAALVASTVQKANNEIEDMKHEVASLEAALKMAKSDYQNVLDELDAVNSRFDEARSEAHRVGRDEAIEELKAKMKADAEHEVATLKQQLEKLSQENTLLQQKVDDTEMKLAAIKDSQESNEAQAVASAEDSAVVKQLQAQLTRAKEDIAKKETEMKAITSTMEERLTQAEEKATKLEGDLHAAKEKLAESEAHVVVLRRHNERLENTTHIPQSPGQRKSKVTELSDGAPKLPLTPASASRQTSVEREELSSMDSGPTPRRLRTPTNKRSRSTSPASVMKLEYRLIEEGKKYSILQKEYDLLQDQKRMGEVRIKRLEDDLRILQKELFAHGGDSAVVTQMSRLSSLGAHSTQKEVDLIATDADEAKRINEIIESRDVKLMAEELKTIEKKFNSQREYNAQLLSKMLHLQGNIQVYCRIRPMTINEVQRGCKEVAESLSETEVGCFDSRTNKWKSFAFDRVWGPDQSQTSVFQDVEPLALSVVDGFNACIFAYGQTGSGKTYTMEGVESNNEYGISYRTIQKIFHLLTLRQQQQRAAEMFVGDSQDDPAQEVSFNFVMEIGMLEIYNDEVFDLLASTGSSMAEKKQEAARAGGKASLEIKRNADGRIEVPNLRKDRVESIQEVMALLKRGNANRATACTDMNEHSSRSHMVLVVDVMSGLGETYSNKGTLFLVDLAGSERVRKSNVSGDQLKEAGHINKSLAALGNVMEALDRKASHIPYRDSKLTYLLQDALGGNSRTMMIVTICPMDNSYDESVHALMFATRVRRIQLGTAQRNVTSKNLEETVKALTDEMRALTRAKERSESQLHTLKRDNARVQDKLKNLSKAKTQNKSDSKTLEVLRKNNDDMAARWQKEKTAKEEASEELEKAKKEQRVLHQQLGKLKSKVTALERKLEDKENELDSARKRMRQERSVQSASNVRARRDQVLGSRKTTSSTAGSVGGGSMSGTDAPSTPTAESPEDVGEIRAQVLALLEKHDQSKVNRIDIIMEKFKGKEALLLDKMTQRYEGGASSAQKRNELALQRHQERMKKIRESRANGSTPNK